MSSLLKIFYNNKIFHESINNESINNKSINNESINNIRFTKILTKYSTEYNNQLFIQNLCQKLNIDMKDMFYFFIELKNNYTDEKCNNILLENYEITKLDINRINKYINRYTSESIEISKIVNDWPNEINYDLTDGITDDFSNDLTDY
jgi:hypothetical protein